MISGSELLAARLRDAAGPVEDRGATAIFAAWAGTGIRAVMRSRRQHSLAAREQHALRAAATRAGHERAGVLYAGQVPVAATTAVLVPGRLPPRIREILGVASSGAVLPGDDEVPLGTALRGAGAVREPLTTLLTPASREIAVVAAARIWIAGAPVALVTERVYRAFLAAHPEPCAAARP
jgi:hypothetical protein